MLADTAKLTVDLGLNDRFSSGMAAAQRSLAGFNGEVGKLGSKLAGDLSRGLGQAVKNAERLGLAVGGLALGAGAAAVKWAGDFEAQLNTINTIAFATPEALGKIGDGIRDIAKDTGLALDDLTGSYYDLLSAGIKTADAQSVLNNAVTLGIGGLATTKQTVDLLTTAYNAYGLNAAGAAKATDMFAQAVADGKVTAAQIAETFSNVASVAKAYGIGIDQIAASYGYLTAQGVAASEVTTEMQRAIISLIKPLPALEDAQKKLKINFTDEIRTKGLIPALQELREYSDKTKIPLIELLGRVEAVKFVLQTTGSQESGFLSELDRINSSSGMAAKQAAERQQGFNNELAKFKARVHDAGITIGSELLPQLTPMVKQLNDFLDNNEGGIKRFGADLAGAFKDVVGWVKKLDFKAIGDQLKFAGQMAKSIVDTFLNLPPGIQQLLTGLFVANKFTGGAVQAIVGDLAGAFVKGVLGITAGVVNINAGVVNGGVGGAGAAGGLGLAPLIPLVVLAVGAYIGTQSTLGFADANNAGAAAGLTPAQVTALRYNNSSPADQEIFRKHNYGQVPTVPAGMYGSTSYYGAGRDTERSGIGLAIRDAQRSLIAAYDEMVAATKKTAHALATAGVGGSGKTFHDFLLTFRTTGAGFEKEFKYLQTAPGKDPVMFNKSVNQDIAALKRLQQQAINRGDTHTANKIAAEIKLLRTLLKDGIPVTPKANDWAQQLRNATTVNVTVKTTVTASQVGKTQSHVNTYGHYYTGVI